MTFNASLDEVVAENHNGLLSIAPHWERVRLGLIASVQNGAPFSSKRFNDSTGLPIVRIRDVQRGFTRTYYDGEYEERYLLNKDDVLIGMDGDFHVGRWPGPTALLNQRVCRVIPNGQQYHRWLLLHALPGYLAAVHRHTSAITVKHLSSRTVADLPLPLPPLPEQRRIVAAIEQHFSRLDAAVATLERVKAKLGQTKASVLKAAVEGRLVPTEAAQAAAEGRDYEHASVLLERILAERRKKHDEAQAGAKRKKRYKEPVDPDVEGLPALPEGWVWAGLDQMGSWTSGGTPKRGRADSYGGSVPWFKTGELTDGYLRASEETLTAAGIDGSSAKVFPPGTLLVAMYGATIGMTGVLRLPAATNQACAALLPVFSDTLLAYIWRFLWASKGAFRRAGQGGAQPNISQRIIRAWPIPLPPLAEQHRIVAEVDRQLSVLDEVGRLVDTNLTRCARLRQAILKRAFEGRLVPQDPNDEPASVLLERIKAQAAAAPKKNTRRCRGTA